MPQLTEGVILAAIEGFEAQKVRIDQQIAELRTMLPGGGSVGSDDSQAAPHRKRKLSPEALERIRAGQVRRWARIRGEMGPSASAPAEAPKPKRKLSAAAKAKLVANLKKARAAKAAKAKGTRKPAPARKSVVSKKGALIPARAKAVKRAPAKKPAAVGTAPAAPAAEAAQ